MKTFFKNNWLTALIAAQPLLDALAFFTRNEVATAAGYIRLGILMVLPLYLLFALREKKGFLLSMGVIGGYCLLHVLNCFRTGYISLYFDLAYLLKVVQMPVLAVCLTYLIRDEQTKRQAYRGLAAAMILLGSCMLLAFVTGTGNSTYGEGVGFSGWVINDNRNAHSIILVTLSCFAGYFALNSNRIWLKIALPLLITLAFLTNGTKGCYFSLFGIFTGFSAYLLLERPILGKRPRLRMLALFVGLMTFSLVIYPYTPRARVSEAQAKAAKQGEIEAVLLEKGIDISTMTPEERFADPVVKEVYEYYYFRYMVGVLPDLFERFGMDRVLWHFNMSTDVAKLIDTREIKRCYSAMIFEDSDFATKLLGFEVSEIGFDGTHDLENDWPAIYYYYGWLGLALYALFILYFFLLVLRRLREDFKGSFTLENVTLLMCLCLQLGLAQFSGAVLRRPNVSIYLALVLALIAYQCVCLPAKEEKSL